MNRIPIKIVYEDKHLIVIEKDAGLLSVATQKGGTAAKPELTAHRLLCNYMQNTSSGRKWTNGKPRVFIVHRLDRETSGLMVFAKTEEIKRQMQENWEECVTHRGYVAVVNNCSNREPGLQQGTIKSWLKENSAYTVYSSNKDNGGQFAVTNYKFLATNTKTNKSLVELELETGRKNQIRVHLQELGYPIYGDKKYYGNNPAMLLENKKARRLYLHAHILNFIHPATGKEMKFTTGIPKWFKTITE